MTTKNLFDLVGRKKSYEQTRKSRHTLESVVSRLSLGSLICILMLTLGVGYAWGQQATLPVDYTFGGNSYPTGCSGNSLGLQGYAAANDPYRLQFNATGDYLQIQTDAAAKQIIFGVKKIGGAGNSTFTVQGSSNGSSYTDIQSFSITGSQNAVVNCTTNVAINSSYRYFRFYFTKSANLGFGTLKISKAEKYTVTFYKTAVTTQAITETSAGAGVTPPTMPATCGDWEFQGWSTADSDDEESSEELETVTLTDGKYYPSENITLYPVYTREATGTITISDVIDYSKIGISGTTYTAWSNKTSNSSAVYAGKSAGGNTSIQLNASSPNGIWTTTSGGTAKKVIIEWNSNTSNGRTIQIFGKSSAYASSDLYSSTPATKGAQIGTIVKGTSTEATLSADYAYIGLRSSSNALYLDKVTIQWETTGSTTYYYSYPTCCTPLGTINGSITLTNEGCTPTQLKATWKMSATTGIASQTLKIYKSSDDSEVTGSRITGISASTSNQTQTITGLNPCETYYVKVENVSSGSSYCEGGVIGTSGTATTLGYTLTVTKSNCSISSGSEPARICSNVSVTYSASTGYALPTSITVTNAGAQNTGWTWNSGTGVLTINKANVTGNVSVTITPTCVSPVVGTDPADADYYVGDSPDALSVSATLASGTLTYLWKVSTNGGSTWSNATGTNNAATYSGASLSTASAGTIKFKCIVGNSQGGCTVESEVATITVTAASYFVNGETVFIQADSKDYSAWKDDACVKALFNNNWSGGSAETTYWLFDATDTDAGKKLFATVVPASGDLNIVQLQRFAGNCSDKWNDNGSVNKASSNGVNTFRSYGSADNNVAWNGSSTSLYLYGSQNSWASSLGTFTDQGAGVWTATISNYTPDATSKDYKIKTSYNNGWIGNGGSNDNATLSGMIVGSTYNVTATLNVTTHALTMSKTFVKGEVSFDLQDHGSAISKLTNVAAGSKISAPSPAPSETGWTFGGWYKDAECTDDWDFANDVVNETMTLYAKWTINSHTLTWNWNGGSTSSESYTTAGSKNYGTTITYPANNTMSKTGYNFSSWSSSPSGNPTSMPDADLTITANWTAKTYTITLDLEGGTTGATSLTMTYNSSSFTGWTAPTKAGYTFGGYYKDDDGTGAQIINASGVLQASTAYTGAGGIWTNDGAVTLHAKWTAKNYTVTLNDGSGSGGSGSKSVTYNSNTNLTSNVAVPTYTGNDFRGYFTSTGGSGTKVIDGTGAWIKGTSYVDASGNWVYDGSPTLYAYWTAYEYENYRTSCSDMYDIVLDDGLVATTNNGSAKVANNGTALTSLVAPTKNGYDIDYYCTTSGLATKIAESTGALSASVTVGGNAWTNSSSQWVRGAGETFYTKWTAHTYNLTYEGLEGATHSNPATYTIETATITLTNPSARTGYTFTGWTCGGDAITTIAIGSTGDKTITANWSINTPNLAVSAVDHVVITATPASELAIAEGANRNVNYNKTITLNCTPDEHWSLAWDVYKTGESSTKVALTGDGDGATFAMPDYAVTVTAVMTEATYHTATFKNNGAVIDGYDGVKTYDGERPSAPTLTDITDACDKTDCNKFYGWIAEDGIWNQTINSVVGKTIYRSASSIPVVSGADVVYHAVWAKGEAAPALIAPTPIIYWARQSIAVSTNISATSGTGTLNSNVAFTSDTYAKVYNSASLSSYPTITLSNLNMSSATGSTVSISFFTRGTNASKGDMTVKYTDQGEESTAGVVTVLNGIIAYHEVSGIPKTATQIKLVHSANSGNLAIGTIKIFEPNTTSYTFTELTSENTSGWANADWDGNYLITNGSTNALDGNGIGEKNFATVSASDGTITTTNSGAAFVVTWVSGSGFKVQGVGCGDYLNTASNSVAPSESIVYLSGIAYNGITDGSSNTLKYNSTKFGFYASAGTDIKLYKILPSFSEFRITCCDNTVTIGTPAKTGSGTVTFASGGDAYVAGDEVETCYGATTITATVTPTNGYQCTALSFTRSDSEDLTPDPAISVPFTGAASYNLTFEQNADGVTLNTTVTFVALIDHYIDNMHYNTTQNKSGNYGTAPTLSDESKGEQCTGLHYRFIGWIPEEDMNMTTGVPTTTANMVAGGATGKYATGTNYYAIWAEEE